MNKRTAAIAVIGPIAIGGVCAAALAQAGRAVVFHGSVVSSDVSMVGGRPYVPLADMARALGGRVAPHGGGYEIVTGASGGPAGGANEVRGQNGKIGDWFFNGYWRFQVVDMQRTDDYHYRYATASSGDKPNGDNDELIVFTCHIKNGRNEAEEPILSAHGLATQNTALTDDQGQSYAPVDFDMRNGTLIPGSAKTFAVVFSVPKGTHLQTFIFTMYGYGFTSNKATSVRVALTP